MLAGLANIVRQVPEVTDYQAYAGTAAPINFNGLVRQYYLRGDSNQGDLQVNLVDKRDRSRKSHDIARAIRPALAAEGKRLGAASVQVVEVPPGPPVQAPLVAEIYGPVYAAQEKVGRALRVMFDATPDIVDTDDTLAAPATRYVVALDRAKAALLGVSQAEATEALATALAGQDATFVHSGRERDPIAVRLEFGSADKQGLEQALALPVRATTRRARPAVRSGHVSPRSRGTRRSTTRICCRWCSSPATWPAGSTVRCTACSAWSRKSTRRRPPASR